MSRNLRNHGEHRYLGRAEQGLCDGAAGRDGHRLHRAGRNLGRDARFGSYVRVLEGIHRWPQRPTGTPVNAGTCRSLTETMPLSATTAIARAMTTGQPPADQATPERLPNTDEPA